MSIVVAATVLLTCSTLGQSLSVVSEQSQPPDAESGLARIGVRHGPGGQAEFYDTHTGEPFTPMGFNHVVLSGGDEGWHGLFNTGIYDADAAEAALARMAEAGANTVRVWAWGVQDETGYTGGPDSHGLNSAYMDNVVDFLRRACRHGLYVIPILDETPRNARYDAIVAAADKQQPCDGVTGYNRQYLTPGLIEAKAEAASDFVQYIKDVEPGLLSGVLGWAFANEVFVLHTEGPFNRSDGKVTIANGRSYDMASETERQACYDDGILHWANRLSRAVKEVDPDALTTAGMWTSDAHGRPPVSGLIPDDRDPRRPPRPSVLGGAQSALGFIDVHIYPWDGTSKVRAVAHERGPNDVPMPKPAIVGEFGVFKNKSLPEAKAMMREMLSQAYDLGYLGALHWVWDMRHVKGQTWSSVEGGLAPFVMKLNPPE